MAESAIGYVNAWLDSVAPEGKDRSKAALPADGRSRVKSTWMALSRVT